ncbi:MAG: ABC transporter permease [Holdemania massiliensis]
MKKHSSLLPGLLLVALILAMCLISFFWLPMDPNKMDTANRFALPTFSHWLGTDQFGRDVLSRVMIASRSALLVGLGSVSVGTAAGLLLGSLAAMAGPRLQALIMRIIDGFMAFPGILLAMMLVAVLGKGLINSVIAIGIFMIPFLPTGIFDDPETNPVVCQSRTQLWLPLRTDRHQSYLSDMLPRLITQFSPRSAEPF